MSQMTEAAKKRMEETSEQYVNTHYPEFWSVGAPKYSPVERMIASLGYQTGYQAGMQDQDANKELLDTAIQYVEDLMYPEAKNRDMGTYNKAIQDAVNRLNKIREARK